VIEAPPAHAEEAVGAACTIGELKELSLQAVRMWLAPIIETSSLKSLANREPVAMIAFLRSLWPQSLERRLPIVGARGELWNSEGC